MQRTMLEIVNQLDGFDSRGNIKVCIWQVEQWRRWGREGEGQGLIGWSATQFARGHGLDGSYVKRG